MVTQRSATGSNNIDYREGSPSGVFRASAQGPAGPAGPDGANGRDPDFNAFTISTPTAVMVDSGSGFNAIAGPIAEDDLIRIRFAGVDGLDLDNGASVTFRISNAAQTIFAWGQVTDRDAGPDTNNPYSEFTIRVRRIDQDTTTTGYPAGSAANMA